MRFLRAGQLALLLGSAALTGAQQQTPPSPPPATSSSLPAREQLHPEPAPLEFESRGLDYEALTKNGITVMFAQLPTRIRDFNVLQVTITNGSLLNWTVKPTDFTFVKQGGGVIPALSADDVVEALL